MLPIILPPRNLVGTDSISDRTATRFWRGSRRLGRRGLLYAATCLACSISTRGAEFPATLNESPAGTGYFSALVSDSFSAVNAAGGDDWSFDAETGDRLSVRLQAAAIGASLSIQVLNPANAVVQSANGAGSLSAFHDFSIPSPGKYRIRVFTTTTAASTSPYSARLELARGFGLEREPNNTIATATEPPPTLGAGQFSVRTAGALDLADPLDVFRIGHLFPGESVSSTLVPGSLGGISTNQVEVALLRLGSTSPVTSSTSGNLASGVPVEDDYFLRVAPVPQGGSALAFAGNSAVNVPISVIDGAGDVSVAFFFRTTQTNPQTLLSAGNAANATEFVFDLISNGTQARVFTGEVAAVATFSLPIVTDGNWHHFALARRDAVNQIELWVDGVSRGTVGAVINPLTLTGGGFVIGQRRNADGTFAAGQGLVGGIDHLRIWRRLITDAEVARFQETSFDATNLALAYTFNDGSGTTVDDSSPAAADGSFATGGALINPTWTTSAIPLFQRGIDATYYAATTITDTISPTVTDTSLPAASATVSSLIYSFTLTFSEEMNPVAVNNPSNYEVRGAGADNTFGNADDVLYAIVAPTYTTGRTVTLVPANAPLQPGLVRFRADVGLTDRAANPLAAPFVRTFTLERLDNYRTESPGNDSLATATALSLGAPGAPDGSFSLASTSNTVTGDSYGLRAADLNGDGLPDLVRANYSGTVVRVLLNQPGSPGTFAPAVDYTVGTNPFGVALVDIDNDADRDIVVTNLSSNTVSVLRNQGAGTFAAAVNYTVGSQPRFIAVGDFDKQNGLDLAVANYGSTSLSILLNNGSGVFTVQPQLTVTGNPHGIATADFNGDNNLDLVTANYNNSTATILLGNGSGGFAISSTFASGINGWTVAAGDVTGDTINDLVVGPAGSGQMFVHRGLGDGTFALPFFVGTTGGDYHDVLIADYDGDTRNDILAVRSNELVYVHGEPGGTLAAAGTQAWNSTLRSLALANFDNAGALDVAVARSNGETRLFVQNLSQPLVGDPVGSDIRHAFGRGLRETDTDSDFYYFTARAGDRFTLVTDSIGQANSASLVYTVFNPNGTQLVAVGTDGAGVLQMAPFTIGTPGRYFVRVSENNAYRGEYRFRVTLAPAPWQIESEANNTVATADLLTFASVSPGSRRAQVLGHIARGDPSDHYLVGTYAVGTQITLTIAKPGFSSLGATLSLLNGAGTVIASDAVTALTHTLTAAQAGAVFARITGVPAALESQYHLTVDTVDSAAPTVTATTLPAENATATAVIDRFDLSFSEDMAAAPINASASYDLRNAGANGTFGDSDDQLYTVAPLPVYSAGLTVNLLISDGPLQPGSYRFRATTALTDTFGNPLAAAFERNFTVSGVPLFVVESRSNDTAVTATSLAPGGVGTAFDGSWVPTPLLVGLGDGPYLLGVGDLNDDGHLDVVSTDENSGTISALLGNGNGSFQTRASHPAPNNPRGLVVADFNGDGYDDVAVTRFTGTRVRVWLAAGNGSGVLTQQTTELVTGTNPHGLAVGQLSNDTVPDLVVADYTNNRVSIFRGNGDGTFQTAVTVAVTGNPWSVATGDLNHDGRTDIAVGTYNTPAVKVLYQQVDGSFVEGANFPWTDNVTTVAVGDVTGDGRADVLVAQNFGSMLRLHRQQSDGTLGAAEETPFGTTTTSYSVRLFDYDGDGDNDVVVARPSELAIFENLGGGVFSSPSRPDTGTTSQDAWVGDFNEDGRPDLAVAANNTDQLRLYLGAGQQVLAADGDGRIGYARGNNSSGTDVDYFSFSAKAGERVIIGTETPGNVNNTGLFYLVYRGDDTNPIFSFASGNNGTGQTQFVAPVSGTYHVRVSENFDYRGEYRFAVAVLPSTYGLESEANDTVGSADLLPLVQEAGAQVALAAGYLRFGDPGDVFSLGNLAEGVAVALTVSKPPSSGLVWIVDVLNSGGTAVATSAVAAPTLSYTVPAGASGSYYARIRASNGAGLAAQYRIRVELADGQGPTVTGDTLPAQGATVTTIFDRFTLSFSEDMLAATVNNAGNYSLRSAGPDGSFDNGDDVVYTVGLLVPYVSGLSASYLVSDGPLQPGLYRFRATTALRDRSGNPLGAAYERTFTMSGVPLFVVESRSNDTAVTATSLAPGGVGAAFDGSWVPTPVLVGLGDGPYLLGVGDLNNDGHLDVVSTDENSGTISALLGNGNGSFQPRASHAAPNNPRGLVVADFNGDGYDDVAVTRYTGARVRVWLAAGNGSGVLTQQTTELVTGTNPHGIAVGQLSNDTVPDLVVADYNSNRVSIFRGNGDGTFQTAVSVTVTGNPWSVATGDINHDGRTDIAVGAYNTPAVKVLYQQVDGSFVEGANFPWTDNVTTVAVGDVTGDGRADVLAAQNFGSMLRLHRQQSDGTLGAAEEIPFGSTTTSYSIRLFDYDGDGDNDVVVARPSELAIFENLGGGVFASPSRPDTGVTSQDAWVGDFNEDGRPDLAVAATSTDQLRLYLGAGQQALAADGDGRIGYARGNNSSNSDVDYFSFSAKAGERVIIGTETPGNANSTGLFYIIYRADDTNPIFSFASGSNGTGQTQFVAPVSGTYQVRVSENFSYRGEYRLAVAVLPAFYGLESEVNDSVANADALPLVQDVDAQTAFMAGYLRFGDPGDIFALGNLAEETVITLNLAKPSSSGLVWIVEVLNSEGAVLTTSVPDAPTFEYTVPSGASGSYYARIRANSGAGLTAQYRLLVELADVQEPSIASDTLPAQGATVTTFFDRFSLTFSEDMLASAVNNLANYNLRSAGPDDSFDTSDDIVVPLVLHTPYTTGLTATLRAASGAVSPGVYRFTAGTGLQDKALNPLPAAYTRLFTLAQIPGFATEPEPNNTVATAAPLPLTSTHLNFHTGAGRGFLFNGSDLDYWSFQANAGDYVVFAFDVPGNPVNSGLLYTLFAPNGTTQLVSLTSPNNGRGQSEAILIATSGVYTVRVSEWFSYSGEYRLRVSRYVDPVQVEDEPNNGLPTATPLLLETAGSNLQATIGGYLAAPSDLDYFNLGPLPAGVTVFLAARLPTSSTLIPVVSLYNASDVFQPEVGAGRPFDGVAQVNITTPGTYYALIRGGAGTGDLMAEYLLDVLVVPTGGGGSFPNLQVVSLTPPNGVGLQSGSSINFSFRVQNVGSAATGATNWFDRVVLSANPIAGDADDVPLATIGHSGALTPGQSYEVPVAANLPDGVSGSFFVIVQTDLTNVVNEFILEGDNQTSTENPISVALSPYPDLVIEGFAVSASTGTGERTVSWTTANRGAAPALGGFNERVRVVNQTTGQVLLSNVRVVSSNLAAGATRPDTATFTTTAAGSYLVEVVTDFGDQRFEFNASGHVAAEANNTASASFVIIRQFAIAVAAAPPEAGSVTGGGLYPEGTPVTVTATPNTSVLPWLFSSWREGEFLRSTNPAYTFTPTTDRTLTAQFVLPTYLIATQVAPAGTGVVTGGGLHIYNTTVDLTAAPQPGYRFVNWTEGATVLANVNTLSFAALGNRTIVATFAESNPTHAVTLATSPAGIATLVGAGTYANGASLLLTAPATVIQGDTEYLFQRWTLNGAFLTNTRELTKVFTTLDAPALAYVAVYNGRSLKPVIAAASSTVANPIRVNRDVQLSFRFDRTMNPSVTPQVTLTGGPAAPTVPSGGAWSSESGGTNNTYTTPIFRFGAGSGGTYAVNVSLAQDTQARVMDPAANVLSLVTDSSAPPAPIVTVTAYTNTTATLSWPAYVAPADLSTFRVYREATTFSSVSALTPIFGTSSGARTVTLTGLAPDTDYFAAVVAVDQAGNFIDAVTPLTVRIVSALPPPVLVMLTAPTLTSANLNWTSYNTTSLLGFDHFDVYRSETTFSNVTGMTPVATLPVATKTYTDSGLDRTNTYYYAVVGVNSRGQFNPAVTVSIWVDPLASPITSNLTLGGTGAAASDVIIYSPLTVQNGATLTILPGTTLRFAPDTSLTVTAGRLIADGQPLAPIHFTSLKDGAGTPTLGDWDGIVLADPTRSSTVRHVRLRYGGGLSLAGQPVTLDQFAAIFNSGAGLEVSGGLNLTAQRLFLAGNEAGLHVDVGSQATLTNSVLKNNTLNAFTTGTGIFNATGNWWGVTGSAIAPTVMGNVNLGTPLTGEPVLLGALGLPGGATFTSSLNISLLVGTLNASAYRISENSAFPGVLFTDVPGASEAGGNVHQVAPFSVPFTLSSGVGAKTVFLQVRTLTGNLGTPVSFSLQYTAQGPAITAFNLTEGQTISRPIVVNATASSTLGLAALEFYVDDVLTLSSATTTLSATWDVRGLTPGIRRVKILARDTSGTIATRELNVQVTPTPPTAPRITSPVNGAQFTTSPITVGGTGEPGIALRLTRNGAVVTNLVVPGTGAFSVPGVSLVEGANELVATSFDSAGSASSLPITVGLDSGAPQAVILDAPVYDFPSRRVRLTWHFGPTGEQPTQFRIFWSTTPFTNPAAATDSSALQVGTQYYFSSQLDGLYYFGVVGYDAAGNASPLSNVLSTVFDSTAPTFTIAYSKASPVGPGSLDVTVQASESLLETPILKIRASDRPSPLTVTLALVAPRTWTGTYTVNDISTSSGPAEVTVSGRDLAQNLRTATITSPGLVFDVTRPTGVLTFDQSSPINTANPVTLAVNLTLSEAAKAGTPPQLRFQPPTGTLFTVPITFNAAAQTWSGSVNLLPTMGDGVGTFLLSATDAQDNIGTVLSSGGSIELYTGGTPPAPGVPSALQAAAQVGGVIRLQWVSGANATSYNIYREAGAGGPPTTLLVGDVTATSYDDLPPADGAYRYVVKAERLNVESASTNVAGAISDRTPPGAPQTVQTVLLATGVRTTFAAPTGEVPARYVVRRNGLAIRTLNTPQAVTDSPPRGVLTYSVAAQDSLGNETSVSAAPIELFVGAVSNLQALARNLQAPVLTWTRSDPTAVGVNIYRGGVKLNSAPVANNVFTDTVQLDQEVLEYVVRAVNASAQESAPRIVTVRPFDLALLLNPQPNGQQRLSATNYFDTLTVNLTNLNPTGPIQTTAATFERAVVGDDPLDLVRPWTTAIAGGQTGTASFVVPSPGVPVAGQAYTVTIETGGGETEGAVAYQRVFTLPAAESSTAMIAISTPQTPLAGGLATIRAEFFNRGGAPIDIVLSRKATVDPGDVYVSVRDLNGVEVSRHSVAGSFPGMLILPDGRGYLRIDPESSKTIDIPGVLVPAALGAAGSAQFVVVVEPVLNAIGAPLQLSSGPLSGTMTSSLAQTPYFGTSSTPQAVYADNAAIVISGQAIDRATGNPLPNVPMKIGFSARGFTWYQDVTGDGAGNYSFSYTPFAGFAGRLTIWTVHPDVFDQLNQTTVDIYRLYVTPQRGEIRMSKNDTFEFSLALVNPGDLPLGDFTTSFRAYTVGSGGVEQPINTVTGTLVSAPPTLGARINGQAQFRLTSALDAPDNCLIEFTIATAQGATAKFPATLSLLPAVPIITVVDPAVGFVDVSVNRGQVVSRQVTVENRGQRDLTNVELVPPPNVAWFQVNVPTGADGKLHLPDLPVGGTATFGVVFTPPPDAPLGYTSDKLRIRGDGAVADFEVGLFAQVTSAERGDLLFTVENTLVQRVPGTSVRLRNTQVNQELGPFQTDASGQLHIPSISEGTWSWQASAPGHQTRTGTIDVVAAQTTPVYVMLHRALVSVRFSVVPVPFTDRYEIRVEQTFETHVPFPVMVFEPPRYDFGTVQPGFETTVLYNLSNKGLVSVFDVNVRGQEGGAMSITPLISFLPELRAQETVQIPVRVKVLIGLTDPAGGGAGTGVSGLRASTASASSTSTSAGRGGLSGDTSGGRFSTLADGDGGGGGGGGAGGGGEGIPCGLGSGAGLKKIPDFGPFVGGVGGLQLPGCEDRTPSFGEFLNGIAAIAACGRATCSNGVPAEVLAAALAAAAVYQTLTGPLGNANPIKAAISYVGAQISCISKLFGSSNNTGNGNGPGGGGGSYSGGYCCFTPGTTVRLADGTLAPIESLQEGSLVFADNFNRSARVSRIVRLQSTGLRQILVRPIGSDETPRLLSLNGEHRVWHAQRGWVPAGRLVVGDWVRGEKGALLELVANDEVPGQHEVYSFMLDGDKAAYVGGVLVEDMCETDYLNTLPNRTVEVNP